jgi:cytoskeletal protein CcmA (bactofilin family)
MFQYSNKPDPATPPSAAIASPDRPYAPASSARAAAVLSNGVSIKGDVTFRNELVIDGEVEGTIKSSGVLIIGEHGRIRGEITAGSVTIHGTVKGNVFVSERCVVAAGGSVRGNIEGPSLALDENATFLGRAKIRAKRG